MPGCGPCDRCTIAASDYPCAEGPCCASGNRAQRLFAIGRRTVRALAVGGPNISHPTLDAACSVGSDPSLAFPNLLWGSGQAGWCRRGVNNSRTLRLGRGVLAFGALVSRDRCVLIASLRSHGA